MNFSLRFVLVAIACIVVGDTVLRLTSLGQLPSNAVQWMTVVGRPEFINSVATIVILGLAAMVRVQPSSALSAILSAVLAVITTAVHRWVVGPVFTPNAMIVTTVIFFVLVWVSLWVATTTAIEKEKNH